eukprot:TRINITY_DN10545_c0_g2_i3.p1 TRINITY_DN10545_c0_g2~~TRINITY_DN10545_c0_g2_i3.p1  ORF type:complete len:315 (-),score=70.75 TRINITY_DN10545_c0_g2_i3:196-1074(-)
MAALLQILALAMLPGVASFKVIVAGFPKTGLASMDAALKQLNYKVYRMGHGHHAHHHIEGGHQADLQSWLDCISGESPEDSLDALSDRLVAGGYDAILDVPLDLTFIALHLARKYPESKVLLTEHPNSKAWFKNYMFHMQDFGLESRRWQLHIPGNTVRALRKVDEAVAQKRGLPLVPKEEDEEGYIKAYEQHNQEIKNGVPSDRLLIHAPEQGWTPLCKFLDVPEPMPARPYPRLNSHLEDEFHMRWQQDYNFKFSCMFFGIIGFGVGMSALGIYENWQKGKKVTEEKANV